MPVYNRDKTIAAIWSYYDFLTRTHIDKNDVQWPPENGWPHLTDEVLSNTGKTQRVNDLARHIPYINPDNSIYHRTSVDSGFGDLSDFCSVPPYVLLLASAGREGFHFLLDTERGTMTMYSTQYETEFTELSDEDADSEGQDQWRCHTTYEIGEFFELLKENFRSFRVVVSSVREVEFASGWPEDDEELREYVRIYREHGYLTEDFRMSECFDKLEEAGL